MPVQQLNLREGLQQEQKKVELLEEDILEEKLQEQKQKHEEEKEQILQKPSSSQERIQHLEHENRQHIEEGDCMGKLKEKTARLEKIVKSQKNTIEQLELKLRTHQIMAHQQKMEHTQKIQLLVRFHPQQLCGFTMQVLFAHHSMSAVAACVGSRGIPPHPASVFGCEASLRTESSCRHCGHECARRQVTLNPSQYSALQKPTNTSIGKLLLLPCRKAMGVQGAVLLSRPLEAVRLAPASTALVRISASRLLVLTQCSCMYLPSNLL